MVARKYFTYIRLEGVRLPTAIRHHLHPPPSPAAAWRSPPPPRPHRRAPCPTTQPWSRSAPRRCPSGVLPGLLRLLTAFAAAALFVTIRPRFPNAVFAEESFRARPMWYRLAYMWCLGFAVRCRFYFAWKARRFSISRHPFRCRCSLLIPLARFLNPTSPPRHQIAEAGNCFSGLGFTGFGAGGRATWDGGKNVDIARTELPGTAAELAQARQPMHGAWRACGSAPA